MRSEGRRGGAADGARARTTAHHAMHLPLYIIYIMRIVAAAVSGLRAFLCVYMVSVGRSVPIIPASAASKVR